MKVKNKKKGFSMIEILISAAIILSVSSIVIKAYSDYLNKKKSLYIRENNKELFYIVCEEIKYNLDIDGIEENLFYISLEGDGGNKVINNPIESLIFDKCNGSNYISILVNEDEKQLEFNVSLYCNGELYIERIVRRSKIIIWRKKDLH